MRKTSNYEIIKKNVDFQSTLKKGTRGKSKFLTYFVLPNKQQKIRFGISVPKKNYIAVQRNRLKRKAKAAIFNLFKGQNKTKNVDVIIIFRVNCNRIKFQDLFLDLRIIVKKEKLLG